MFVYVGIHLSAGPAWLEYSWDDVDDVLEGAKAAAAAQLEREGLAIRRKKMFTATRRRRWQALEMQVGRILYSRLCYIVILQELCHLITSERIMAGGRDGRRQDVCQGVIH